MSSWWFGSVHNTQCPSPHGRNVSSTTHVAMYSYKMPRQQHISEMVDATK